jgi:DNA polymerase-4
MKEKVIMLADCQSFYASVEKASHPEFQNKPLVVAGDPKRRSGIILAACPLAKKYGITTAETLGEALWKCPDVVVIQPRMQEYINVSMQITKILETFSDLVEPFSIDEQFIDVTASQRLFGSPHEIATSIQDKVMSETGVYTRIGLSDCKVVAKMACDNFAKKNSDGIFELHKDDIPAVLWTLPIHKMYQVGSRMTHHLMRMGIRTIGDLATTEVSRLEKRWGVNGRVLWQIANGIDSSPVSPYTHEQQQKAIGHQMTLPRDYITLEDILVVVLELCELVCQRCRSKGLMGSVLSLGCQGADFDHPNGFQRQMKMSFPTNVTNHIYKSARTLFTRHWDGYPIRKIGVSLSELENDTEYQMSLFDVNERDKFRSLEKATDTLKRRYGETAIMRAVSLSPAGQIKDRSKKIGGHYK